jgi:dihydroorotate dehydrogenase
LFLQDSERIHNRTLRALGVASRSGVLRAAGGWMYGAQELPVEVFGLRFPNPVGLAAGMDKVAEALPMWAALGFGFSELGGVTRHGQPGNDLPRMFRVIPDGALVNRMGFNNPGAEVFAQALEGWRSAGLWPRHPVGVNLGKSKVTPLDQAPEDYAFSFRRLHALADFFVVNVSSPNTPNLRKLQDRAALEEILVALKEAETSLGGVRRPLLVKVAPDLTLDALDEILDLATSRGLAGWLVATNTTIARPDAGSDPARRAYTETGGLSGRPLRARSTEVIRHLYRQTRGRTSDHRGGWHFLGGGRVGEGHGRRLADPSVQRHGVRRARDHEDAGAWAGGAGGSCGSTRFALRGGDGCQVGERPRPPCRAEFPVDGRRELRQPARMMFGICRWMACALAVLSLGLTGRVLAAGPSVSIRVVGEQLNLSWGPVEAGAMSTVESTPALGPVDWQPVGGAAGWPVSGTNWTGRVGGGTGAAFFRVAVRPAPARGTIETSVRLRTLTVAEVQTVMAGYSLPPAGALGVEAWRVVYATPDAKGNPSRASALVVLPVNAGKALPMVSYQHGTILEREAVPSRLVGEADIGLVLGGSGYVAVLPDYLGMGDSPGFHPYQHAASEATAVVDALRAARVLLADQGRMWNQQLFLTGYSQGGHATLAAQRELQLRHAGEFTVTASAPCAGAHDMSGTTATDFLSNRLPPNPYYSAYLLAAVVDVYGVAPSLGALLREPYATTLPPLMDGRTGSGVINAAMPARPADALRPEVLQAFTQDPEHPLRRALRDNDLHTGWFPTAPTRFYHCAGDRDVLKANSEVAFNAFKAAGAPAVELVDPFSFADHGGCAPFSLFGTKTWFDGLKK